MSVHRAPSSHKTSLESLFLPSLGASVILSAAGRAQRPLVRPPLSPAHQQFNLCRTGGTALVESELI